LPAEVAAVSLGPQKKQWPWIPTVVGSSAAIAAGICAVVARDRYNTLADRSQPFQSAQAVKGEGQKWQVASFVLSGVAVASLTTALVGFVTRSSVQSSERSSMSAVATPIPGGGMVAVAGDWP
jgi:ABC-type Fe3+-siderophore transport system permease subunit